MMLPILTKIGILIDFRINQDFIAKVLCVNKDKPNTACNGKCYLSEQLKKVEEQKEKQAPNNPKVEKLEVLYYYYKNSFDYLRIIAGNHLIEINTTYKNSLYSFTFVTDIFHPPNTI